MATKKHIELQEYSAEELAGELAETVNQYQKLRFDHAIRGMDNPLVLREVRRDIARIKMEIRRRELAEMTTEQLALRSKIRRRRSTARKSK
jgi:large subunit ribosomal protein L29